MPSKPKKTASHQPSRTISAEDAQSSKTPIVFNGRARPDTELIQLVYKELRELAGSFLRKERPDHTLQATALVHEAYLRITQVTSIQWQSRAHFFAFAAEIIRRVLVDHARARGRMKRRGDRLQLTLDENTPDSATTHAVDVLDLDEALAHLAKRHERAARVVELRYFGGLTEEEAAAHLDVSVRTVRNDWKTAKAWLAHHLRGGYSS